MVGWCQSRALLACVILLRGRRYRERAHERPKGAEGTQRFSLSRGELGRWCLSRNVRPSLRRSRRGARGPPGPVLRLERPSSRLRGPGDRRARARRRDRHRGHRWAAPRKAKFPGATPARDRALASYTCKTNFIARGSRPRDGFPGINASFKAVALSCEEITESESLVCRNSEGCCARSRPFPIAGKVKPRPGL